MLTKNKKYLYMEYVYFLYIKMSHFWTPPSFSQNEKESRPKKEIQRIINQVTWINEMDKIILEKYIEMLELWKTTVMEQAELIKDQKEIIQNQTILIAKQQTKIALLDVLKV